MAASSPRRVRRKWWPIPVSSRPISAAARRPKSGRRMFTEALLDIRGLCTGYSDAEVLHDVDLTVGAGEIVAVLGANGVGKSTLNRTISGVARAWWGTIRFGGVAIEGQQATHIAA